jgi:hypothetical protein
MESMTLEHLLKKKGIITEDEYKELHGDVGDVESVYLHEDTSHMTEEEAKEVVSKMYHMEGNKKYIGEKFNMYKAKEVYEKYENVIPSYVSVCDIYVAINAQYHDYIALYKLWFTECLDKKIIESAMNFWFMDEDYAHLNKVMKYFKGE